MAKIRDLIEQRFSKKEKGSKMASLAEKSAQGELSSFSAIFGKAQLRDEEREALSELLAKYAEDESGREEDLNHLALITAEVRAITNQAAILHGMRIKKAQEILKRYREGAFSAWLIATYGNRQTPYNFLQYYEFHIQMPETLHPQIEAMPRQAIYTLASREGSLDDKSEIVRGYRGETKEELLAKIRSLFPLPEEDRRREDLAQSSIHLLERLLASFSQRKFGARAEQKRRLRELSEQLAALIENLKVNS